MNAPTYTPKSKAEEARVIGWLTDSRINWSSTASTKEGLDVYEIGNNTEPTPGMRGVSLYQFQQTGHAFDLLRQVSEAGGVDTPLLSKINLLLKAVNE